jgi:hypothetical protein
VEREEAHSLQFGVRAAASFKPKFLERLEALAGVQRLCFCQEGVFGLDPVRIFYAGVRRAYRRAFRFIAKTDAFRALFGRYVMKILGECGYALAVYFIILTTFENRLIRAFRLAGTTIDAFFRYL